MIRYEHLHYWERATALDFWIMFLFGALSLLYTVFISSAFLPILLALRLLNTSCRAMGCTCTREHVV